ncbi:uncharacterized protein LOC143020910 [Oratosquilla oratoria]|uniref:uncharacterized protein LOC143020910 n=1 Tax=Oratosquilla oratoria TaxID=337810 RepID=UPI003F776E72
MSCHIYFLIKLSSCLSLQKLKKGSKAAGNKTTSTLPVSPSVLPDSRVDGTLPDAEYNSGECVQVKEHISGDVPTEMDGCIPINNFLELHNYNTCNDILKRRYNVFLPPTSNPNVTATVVDKVADSRCPFFTVHNTSFLANYDQEFASSCHDFICKLKMIDQAPVTDGYTKQYFEHPGSLSRKSKRCMQMAGRNGALYHENEDLIMLSFSKIKRTLPIPSVISYKRTPRVPFHQLGFLFLREKRYECIRWLFPSVADRMEGEFGLIFITVGNYSKVRKYCADIPEASSERIIVKLIPSELKRIILLKKSMYARHCLFNTIFIRSPLRITSNTLNDLYQRLLYTTSSLNQFFFFFNMTQDVLMRHPLLTENGNAITCAFRSESTACGIYSGRVVNVLVFIHEYNPRHYFRYLREYHDLPHIRLLLHTEMQRIRYSNSNDSFVIRVPSAIDKGRFCVFIHYHLIDPGDTQSVPKSQIIHPFTYLRVYHLGSLIECTSMTDYNVYKVEGMKNPYLFFNEHGSTLWKSIAQLEESLGIDELALMTESRYKWFLRTYFQWAVAQISSGCFVEMRAWKGIANEQNTIFVSSYDTKGSPMAIEDCNIITQRNIAFILQKMNYKKETVNLFWPACGNLYSIVITEKFIASEWQYLSTGCQVTQIFFLAITAVITLVTIGGNSFVLYVIHKFRMYEIRSHGAPFFILRSLAVADLLTGVFPGTLAVWDQHCLMTGELTFRKLVYPSDRQYLWFTKLRNVASLGDLRFEREGYPVLCGYVLSVSSIVSLLMLFLLSVERYRGVRNLSFPCVPAAASVATSWIVASIMGLILFNRDDGFRPTGYFDPISKLTVSTAVTVHSSLIIFWLQVAFVGFLGCSMIFITFFTFYTHVSYRLRREKETKVILHAPENVAMQDLKYFFMFFTMMFLYLVSCLPLAVNTFFGLSEVAPVLQFLAWWLFMAGGSWNWYIYSYRRGPFRRNLEKLAKRRENRKKIRREFQEQIEMQQRGNVGVRLRRQN